MIGFIVRLPERLHRAFKVKCAKTGVTMNEKINKWIEREVRNDLPTDRD